MLSRVLATLPARKFRLGELSKLGLHVTLHSVSGRDIGKGEKRTIEKLAENSRSLGRRAA